MPCSIPMLPCGPASDVLSRNAARAFRAVGAGNFRRLAHRRWPHRRCRRYRNDPPIAARARILAHEAAIRGRGHHQREGHLLRAGTARLARSAGPRQPVAAFAGHQRRERQDFSASRGSDLAADARAAAEPSRESVLLSRRGTLVRTDRAVAAHRSRALLPSDQRRAGRNAWTCRCASNASAYFNGLGGFAENGREYAIVLGRGLAHAGALDQRDRQSELSVFSFRNRARDSLGRSTATKIRSRRGPTIHVIDPPGEAIYMRDESTGEIWTPTALPIRHEDAPYTSRGTARATAFPARLARHLARTRSIRSAERFHKDFAADLAE